MEFVESWNQHIIEIDNVKSKIWFLLRSGKWTTKYICSEIVPSLIKIDLLLLGLVLVDVAGIPHFFLSLHGLVRVIYYLASYPHTKKLLKP